MSQQIIEVLDYLFEKFGIAIDWTAENIMPYVQELAGKLVTYNIVSDVMWLVLSVLVIIGCCGYARILYGSYKTCETTKKATLLMEYYSDLETVDFSVGGCITTIIAVVGFVLSLVALFVNCGDLIKWIFIPELQLVEYMSDLINTVQV
jgi:hypothetical protein